MNSTFRVLTTLLVVAIAVAACTSTTKPYVRTVEIAAQYQNQRNFELAEKYHRQALAEMRADPEVSAANLSIQLANVASVLTHYRNPEEALTLLSEAIDIQDRQSEPNSQVLAQVYAIQGRCEELQGHLDASEATYMKALNLAQQIKTWYPAHYGFVLAGLANIYVQENKLEQADDYHRKAKELYATSLGENSAAWRDRATEYSMLRAAASEKRIPRD